MTSWCHTNPWCSLDFTWRLYWKKHQRHRLLVHNRSRTSRLSTSCIYICDHSTDPSTITTTDPALSPYIIARDTQSESSDSSTPESLSSEAEDIHTSFTTVTETSLSSPSLAPTVASTSTQAIPTAPTPVFIPPNTLATQTMAAPPVQNILTRAQPVQASAPVISPLSNLPGRSEHLVPSFNDSQPEELEQYFEDLQALLDQYTVVDDQKQKQAALKYLKIWTEKLWKMTDAWLDPTKTYDKFKTEVFALYPGAIGDRTYTLQDLDTLIGHWTQWYVSYDTMWGIRPIGDTDRRRTRRHKSHTLRKTDGKGGPILAIPATTKQNSKNSKLKQ